ncbi:MAG: HAMP domain-containing histidine kinase, partial [Rhodospirillales bacterium]|nr:HAMP domain-containing histidine kinase [Rhodospirillales bacterium]
EQKSRELEATTAELRAANERLKELDRLKDDFLSTVSHELRTPLTSIRSFSEILFDNPDLDTEERSRFLTIIVKESERLTRLINQILDLAKMEAGRMEWELDDIDPRAVIDEALAVSSGLLAEKSVRLEVKLDGHLPRVHVDRDRLMQVIVNLLSNAVKFCHEAHGLVVVSAETRDEGLYVSVADNGPGVAPENRRMIFEKFQQANEALTDRPGGSGLGLAISRQIVEYFGGRIWVESVPGHGAKFAFTIPLERAPVAQSAE